MAEDAHEETGQAERASAPKRVALVLLLASVPAAVLATGEYLPGWLKPFYPTYPKLFLCQTLAAAFAALGVAWWVAERNAAGAARRSSLRLGFRIALVGYVAWATVGCLWSAWPAGGVRYVIREAVFYVLCAGFCVMFASVKRWATFARVLFVSVLAAALCQGTYIAWEFLAQGGKEPLWKVFHDRPFMHGNRNFACAPAILGALLAVGFALPHVATLRSNDAEGARRPRLRVALAGISIAVFAFTLVAAGSLAGYLAALVAVAAYILCMLPLRRRRLIVCAVVVVAFAAVLAVSYMPALRRGTVDSILESDTTTQARGLWWLAADQMLWDKPLHGQGTGAYASLYYEFAPLMADISPYAVSRLAEHPHNEFLRVAAELGLVGLCLYMALLTVPLIASYRAVKRQHFAFRAIGFALWAGMLGYIVQAALGKAIMLWDFALVYWMLLGVLASAASWPDGQKAPAREPRLRGAAVWVLCAVVAVPAAWLWWSWGVGGYAAMVNMGHAEGYLKAASRRMGGAIVEGKPVPEAALRGIRLAESRLLNAERRTLWPTDAVYLHYALGGTLADVGRWEDAARHLRWVDRVAPGALDSEYLLARCHLRMGDSDKAITFLIRFLRRHPGATEAYTELAPLDLRSAASLLMEQVGREDFADPARTALLGRCLAGLGQWTEVAKLFRDTQDTGAQAALRELGRGVEHYCELTGAWDRLEGLKKRFPGAFAAQPQSGS